MLKIRCSAIGKIMTNARSKSEVLSKTCKSYLQELAIEEMYGIKKEFSSRYTDKGIEVERNVEKALKYLEKLADIKYKNSLFLKTKLLAEKKDKKALFVFGKYLEEGKEIKKNNQEALKN